MNDCCFVGFHKAVGTVIFEERIGSLNDPPSAMAVEFLDNLIGFFVNMQPLMFNAPIYKYWATPTWKTFENHADKVVDAGMYFINKVSSYYLRILGFKN